MADDLHVVKATITGRVQGVSFRNWTLRNALALNVRGWVRNEPDGSVTALLAGARMDVQALVSRLHQGPSAARVEDISVAAADEAEIPSGFSIET